MKQILKNISPFHNRTDMPTVQFVIKKVLAFWLCYIAGLFIAEGAVIALHFAMGKNVLKGEMFSSQTIQLIQYYGYIIIIAVVLLYWKLVEKKPLAEMGLSKKAGSYLIGAAAAAVLVFLSVCGILLTGSIEYHGFFENTNPGIVLLFFGGFVVQGAMEEFLCRGLVLHALKEKTSQAVAIAVSTILFILPHWSSLFAGDTVYGITGIINICLISMIFSLLTLHYRSIWAACGLHSFWNAIIYSVLGLNLSGNDSTAAAIIDMRSVGKTIWNGGDFGIESSLITTVILAAAAALLWAMNKKRK